MNTLTPAEQRGLDEHNHAIFDEERLAIIDPEAHAELLAERAAREDSEDIKTNLGGPECREKCLGKCDNK